MKIIFPEKVKKITFESLEYGQVFILPNEDNETAYIKLLGERNEEDNAVSLSNGDTFFFNMDEDVIPFPNSELILKK